MLINTQARGWYTSLIVAFVTIFFLSRTIAYADDSGLVENPYAVDKKKSCGPACLTFLEQYFGKQLAYNDVVQICPPGPEGVSFADLKVAAEKIGLHTAGFQGTVDSLSRLLTPAILQVRTEQQTNHFVVLLGYSQRDQAYVTFDPPANLKLCTDEELRKRFTGAGLIVSNSEMTLAEAFLPEQPRWQLWTGIELILIASVMLAMKLRSRFRSRTEIGSQVIVGIFLFVFSCMGCSGSSSGNCSVSTAIQHMPVTIPVGTVVQGTDLKGTFNLINDSGSPFKILRVDRTCQCQSVEAEFDREIANGERFKVSVAVPTVGLIGEIKKPFLVVTNSPSPRYAQIELQLSGQVRVPLRPIPARLVLGNVADPTTANRQLTISTDPNSLATGYREARCTNPFIHVTLHSQKSGWLAFDIQLDPHCPSGDLVGAIDFLFTESPYDKLTVPILGERTGDLQAVPSRLFVSPSRLEATVSELRIRSKSAQEFEILRCEAPKYVHVDCVSGGKKKNCHDIQVQIDPTDPNISLNGDAVFVTTSLEDQNLLRIPIVLK